MALCFFVDWAKDGARKSANKRWLMIIKAFDTLGYSKINKLKHMSAGI